MKALVTGGTGFLGRHLVTELSDDNWTVRVLARHAGRARKLPDEVTIVPGDLDDEGSLREAVRGIDVVFHLAAATSGPWEAHRTATVEGTARMLAAARDAGVGRFVLVSSIVVYDKSGLRDGTLIDESAALLEPVPAAGAYARGKIEAERLAQEAAAADPRAIELVIARPGLVYGPGRLGFAHLGELVGETRLAYGKPSLLLPLVEAGSCARALAALGRSPHAAGRTYHIVDAHETTRRDYLQALEALTGHRCRVAYLPAWPVAAACGLLGAAGRRAGLKRAADWSAAKVRTRSVELRYDTAALERDTDWRPLESLDEGLARALGRAPPEAGRARMRGTDRQMSGSAGAGVGAGARSGDSGPRARLEAARRVERIGLVGAGAMAREHVKALARLEAVRLTGVLDTRLEAAEALAREAGGVPAFDDPERFYAEARPEVVHVVTPPGHHAEAALVALRQGAHVLVEKPAATTLEECDALIAAAEQRGLTIGVDETVAFDPLLRRAFALAATGALGDLVHLDVHMGFDLGRGGRLDRILARPDCWELALPGGPLEDLLPHPLSMARALAGPLGVEHWRSWCTGRLGAEFPDELRLQLANGDVTASISISLSSRPDDLLVTVHGTRASLRIDVQNVLFDGLTPLPGPRAAARGLRVLRSGFRTLAQTAGNALGMATGRAPTPASARHLIHAHYAALERGRRLPAPLEDARGDVAIARTIWPMPASTADMARFRACAV